MHANHKAAKGSPSKTAGRFFSRPTVLVIDDERVVRKLIVRLLNKFHPGCRVVQAGDVPEAKKKLLDIVPQLAIVDLHLPHDSGMDICRLIRRHPWFSKTRILVITSYASAQNREKSFAQGAFEFLSKPFTSEELLGSVGRLLA